LSNLLQQSYNNYAIKRDNSEIEPWKIWERKQFLYRLYQEDFKTLLEIGSGPGKDSLFFHHNSFLVTTVDFSNEMVRLCKEKGLPDVHCMDFRYLDFPENRFDAVYALNYLLHVSKAEMDSVILVIHRVMKPNGLFFYGVYGGWDWEGIWEDDTYEPKRFFNFYTDEDIQKLFQKYFILEDFHTIDMGEGKPHFQSMTLRKPND
jgi:SAM-dependent methyltransferase